MNSKKRSAKQRDDIQTILVVGSGPIIIGQAAEFDYAGTQACLAFKRGVSSYLSEFQRRGVSSYLSEFQPCNH